MTISSPGRGLAIAAAKIGARVSTSPFFIASIISGGIIFLPIIVLQRHLRR
jgi:hypothetical protein